MRLIDASAVTKEWIERYFSLQNQITTEDIFYMLKDIPSYKPKTGKWIHEGHDAWNNYYRCSCCKHLFGDNGRKFDTYCSNCGAKMIEEQT